MNGRPRYTDNASRVLAWAEEYAKHTGLKRWIQSIFSWVS